MSDQIKIGDTARDEITGFEGMVVAVTEWINNCRRITIQPRVAKDGSLRDAASFDEPNVTLVKAGPRSQPVLTGGPRHDPKQRG